MKAEVKLLSTNHTKHFFIGIILMLSIVPMTNLHAQNIVDLIRFESAQRTNYNNEPVQRLINAQLIVDDVAMVCDTAYRYIEKSELLAIGNLQIETEDAIIWADSLRYFTKEDLSLLRGRVIIDQDEVRLFGKAVDYDFENKIAHFNKGIRLEDSTGVLIANQGSYFEEVDSAVFIGNVQLSSEEEYAESDRMNIQRKEKRSYLYGQVLIENLSDQQIIQSDSVYADSLGFRRLMGHAAIRTIDETDTSFVLSNTILIHDQDSSFSFRTVTTTESWSADFSTRSDSLYYESESEQFLLTGEPKVWYDRAELSANTIIAQMDSSEIEELYLYQNAFTAVENEQSGRLNQLKSDSLNATFLLGDLHEMVLYPNAEILYFTVNENDENDGAIELQSPRVRLQFLDGEIEELKSESSQGFVFEEDSSLDSRRLDGFQWNPGLRPEKPNRNFTYRFGTITVEPSFELPKRFLDFLSKDTISQPAPK